MGVGPGVEVFAGLHASASGVREGFGFGVPFLGLLAGGLA